MKKFFRNFNYNYEEKIFEELKIKEYILKYIKELQRHFDLPDKRIKIIIRSIYHDLSFFSKIKIIVKKKFEVLKSLIIKKIKQ